MNLEAQIDSIRAQLEVTAAAGGQEEQALAERLVAPLEAAIRLALLDALAAAAQEITLEMAPGSVELRLRGREPEFVVNLPAASSSADAMDEGDVGGAWGAAGAEPRSAPEDEGALSRINLRLAGGLKSRVEQAAAAEALSINAWLIRAAAAALERTGPSRRREGRSAHGAERYSGWAR